MCINKLIIWIEWFNIDFLSLFEEKSINLNKDLDKELDKELDKDLDKELDKDLDNELYNELYKEWDIL